MEKQGDRCQSLVLVPYPFQGHLNAVLELGTILHSRGFSIIIAHTKSHSPDFSTHPDFVFLPLSDESAASKHSDSVDVSTAISNVNSSCKVSLQELLTEMIQKQEQHQRLPCVIHDSIMYCVKEVARNLKLPSIIYNTSCATFTLAYHLCPALQQPDYSLFNDSKSLDKLVPGLDPLRFKDLPIFNVKNTDAFLQIMDGIHDIRTAAAIVFNSLDCLEQSTLAQLRQIYQVPILLIGPVHKVAPSASSSSLLEEDRACIAWLDKQADNSVIYVSLGSIASIDEKELTEMAWGLANSKQPFLWVLRPGSVHGSEAMDLLSDHDFKESIGERCCVVKWAPQKEVLAHRAVGGFWSHCGWNSTLESLSEGVPVICRPFFGDQKINSRYLSHVWRVGIELENDLERVEIKRAVKRLMAEKEGEEMRQRAADLKLEIENSIRKGGSYNSLNELVELIMSF